MAILDRQSTRLIGQSPVSVGKTAKIHPVSCHPRRAAMLNSDAEQRQHLQMMAITTAVFTAVGH